MDRFWAGVFGLDLPQLHQPGVRVVADAPGFDGWEGLYLLALADAVVIHSPLERVEAVLAAVSSTPRDEVFTAAFAGTLARTVGGLVRGPSSHHYVAAGAFFHAPARLDVRALEADDDPALRSLAAAADPNEWAEAGFGPDMPALVWGCFEATELVGAANLTPWGPVPADVGVYTSPAKRDKGVGGALAAAVTATALSTTEVVRYRCLNTNTPSLRIARRLGFSPYGSNFAIR